MIDYIFGKNKQPQNQSPKSQLKVEFNYPAQNQNTLKKQKALQVKQQVQRKDISVTKQKQNSLQLSNKSKQLLSSSQKDFNNLDKQNIRQILLEQREKSEKQLTFIESNSIQNKLTEKQSLAYNAETSDNPKSYLKGIYNQMQPQNQYIKSNIDETISKVAQNISKDIIGSGVSNTQTKHKRQKSSSQYLNQPKKVKNYNIQKKKIPRTKDDLIQMQKIDRYKMIKLKNGEVKDKIGNLKKEMEFQYYNNINRMKIDTSDIVEKGYFSMDHPETKKADSFIKRLNQKRKQQKYMMVQKTHAINSQKEKMKQIQKEIQNKWKEQKKQNMERQFQLKHMQKQIQKLQLQKKREEYKNWVKNYQRDKPLEQKLQDQMVARLIIPELEERNKRLMQIKVQNAPIDFEQIDKHQMRYLQFKRDQQIRHRADLQMKLQNSQIKQEEQSKYFKGKYRLMALESIFQENNKVDQRQIDRSKRQRQQSYAEYIKEVYKPKPRARKLDKMQGTRNLIQRVRNSNGSLSINQSLSQQQKIHQSLTTDRARQARKRQSQTLDAKKQGDKNLVFAINRVRQKLANGKSKKPKIHIIQQRNGHSYLDDIIEKRKMSQSINYENSPLKSSKLSSRSYKNNSQVSTYNNLETLKARTDNLDEKLKRKQQKLKLVKERYSKDGSQMQNNYLKSIKAKLKLVDQIK